jgi:hypothetical protein
VHNNPLILKDYRGLLSFFESYESLKQDATTFGMAHVKMAKGFFIGFEQGMSHPIDSISNMHIPDVSQLREDPLAFAENYGMEAGKAAGVASLVIPICRVGWGLARFGCFAGKAAFSALNRGIQANFMRKTAQNFSMQAAEEISIITKSASSNTVQNFSNEKVLFNFTETAGKHLYDTERKIPVQILDNMIKSSMAVMKDPQGASNSMMYYSQLWKNGKLYNAEVLYNKASNTILHFRYTQKSIGPLKRISK